MSNLIVIGQGDSRLNLEEAVELYKMRWGGIVKAELGITDDRGLTARLIRQQSSRVKAFPEGQIAVIDGFTKEVYATIYSLLIGTSQLPEIRGWNHLTGYGTGKTHNPKGDNLICYAIQSTGKVIGATSALINAQKELANSLGTGLLVFTRPDGLRRYAKKEGMSLDHPDIKKYLDAKINGTTTQYDGVSFHLRHGATLAPFLKGGKPYLTNSRPGDVNSLGFNVLMEYAVR
ncbi:hypothetical protein HYU50_00500 [Candidatus Woesearchaeota archaeon]|nr:hypothetical protein [Candidatus Woesearchaeota archaeon]